MENYEANPATKSVKEISKLNLNNTPVFESYLEKKARNIFAGWQKRYFILLEGKLIIYTESKQNKQVKGYIPIKQISNIKALEANNFSIEIEGRNYLLRAENPNIKNDWIQKIKYAITLINKGSLADNSMSIETKKIYEFASKNDDKSKINSIGIKMGNLAKKYGYILNTEDPLSKLLLEKFGIDKLINLNEKKLVSHIHYGFMSKKQRLNDTYNKRWFFLFSRSSLNNNETNNTNFFLEDKKQKGWIKFDTLYYFKCNKEKSETDNDNKIYDSEIKMEDCYKIINFDKNGKYYMNLDYKERIYEFYCNTKIERDEWFEALINSRRTAKTYKFSITKHPKSIDELYNSFIKSKKFFKEKINAELIAVTGNTDDITEFNIFEFTINNLQNLIESHMDGCLCSLPVKLELLKAYVEYMDKQYLSIFEKYWDKSYNKLNNDEIIKMGLMILKFYDRVNIFHVNDINLLKNGKELIKIYFKKIFPNILFSIENTIKYEIEHKGTKDQEGKYYSEGPKIIFDTFWKIFDLVKNFKHKIIFNFLIKILNMSIFQYCFGVNCVLSNRGVIIEDEYLITVSNDTLTIHELLNNFIDNYINLNIYTEEEIYQEIQIKNIIGIIDKLNNNAIIHLVYEHKDELEKEVLKVKFLKMDLIKIIKKSAEIYSKYKPMMNNRVSKIFYNEILKITLCYYITSLLLITKKKKRKKEDIINKLKTDKEIFLETYKDLIGENLTNSTLKILEDIIGILEIEKTKIATSIILIRQYIGPAFTYSVAKKLIKLRNDLSPEEKLYYLNIVEEVLNGYQSPKEEPSSYYQILSSKIKKNEKDKEYFKIRASQLKFGNEIDPSGRKSWNEIGENANNIENENSDTEDEIRSSIVVNISKEENYLKTSLVDFMKDNEEMEYEVENDYEENEIKEDFEEEDIKPEYQGVFYKKRAASFTKYFYQIKNFGLYWFDDQTSNKPKDKLSLEEVSIINTETEPIKFILKSNSKEGEKEYKFKFNTKEEKNALIQAISKTKRNYKDIKNINTLDIPTIEIKERKMVIKDYFTIKKKIKEINIADNIFEYLKNGQFFKIDKKRMKKAIENQKEKKEKEEGKDVIPAQEQSMKNKIKNLFGRKK